MRKKVRCSGCGWNGYWSETVESDSGRQLFICPVCLLADKDVGFITSIECELVNDPVEACRDNKKEESSQH